MNNKRKMKKKKKKKGGWDEEARGFRSAWASVRPHLQNNQSKMD
jgi:hypothetical protein